MDPKTAVLIILFLVCSLYSIILELVHDIYVPRYLWLTVVIGNAFVIVALWAMEALGVQLTAILILQANVAAGAPVVAWQLHQNYRRAKEMHQS